MMPWPKMALFDTPENRDKWAEKVKCHNETYKEQHGLEAHSVLINLDRYERLLNETGPEAKMPKYASIAEAVEARVLSLLEQGLGKGRSDRVEGDGASYSKSELAHLCRVAFDELHQLPVTEQRERVIEYLNKHGVITG